MAALTARPAPRVELVPRLVGGPGPGDPVDAIAVGLWPAGRDATHPALGPEAAEVAAALGLEPADLADEVEKTEASGEAGRVARVRISQRTDGNGHVGAATSVRSLLFVGLGDASPTAHRRAGAGLARAARRHARLAVGCCRDASEPALRALAEGLLLGDTGLSARSEPDPSTPVERVDLVVARSARRDLALDQARAAAGATRLARELANTPSLTKTPAWLADRAGQVAASSGLTVRVRDEHELAAEGFGGILSVGRGSSRPPRLIELGYVPATTGARARRVPHVVLVGKGITFDSGGISLKPSESMTSMKTDMSGGAAVIAVMGALRELDVGVRVTGLVPAAENLPSGSAQCPGDVIRHYGGLTTEVFNTDAEGRLVLADALAYADEVLEPDAVVDIATLTGAASLGLGRRHGALYSTDEHLTAALVAAGQESGEHLWAMPLVEDYRDALDSDIADLAQVSRNETVRAGSIVAALFLREFTGGRPWAHLDIAGPARADADENEVPAGGTGFGARVLLRWLEQRAPLGLVGRGERGKKRRAIR